MTMLATMLMLAAVQATPAAPTLLEARNATYVGVFDGPVTLKDGLYEGALVVPGSPVRPRAGLAGTLVMTGDLDHDGRPEAVVVLWSSTGGSGERLYLAILGRDGSRVKNLATAAIGDRVKIRRIRLNQNRILLDAVTHGPDEPLCCPTQKQRRIWAFADGTLAEADAIAQGTISVADLEGSWVLTNLDGTEAPPPGVQASLVVKGVTVSGRAGCNRFTGTVGAGASAGSVTVGPLVTTRMACAEPIMAFEAAYLRALQSVSQFTFLAGQLALTCQDGDRPRTLLFSPAPPGE